MRSFPWPGVSTRARFALRRSLAAASALVLTAPAAALTVIGNGDAPPNPTNVIDASDPASEDYRIQPCLAVDLATGCLAPPLPTSARIDAEADVAVVEVVGDSHLDVLGGEIGQIVLRDTSSLLLDSPPPMGALDPQNHVGWLQAFDHASIVVEEALLSAVSLSGNSTLTHLGTIHGIFEVNEQAHMLLQGIPVATGTDSGVLLSGSGSLEMESGWITDNGLQAGGDTRITMSGGTIDVLGVYLYQQAWMQWRGGNVSALDLDDTSVITIAGASFEVDGVAVGLGPVLATSGVLTGTLANGDPFSVPFDRVSSAQLVLVPEPATFVTLGIGLLGLAGASRR